MCICCVRAQYANETVNQQKHCPLNSFTDVRGFCKTCQAGEYMVPQGVLFTIDETVCSPYIEGQYVRLPNLHSNRPAYRKTDKLLYIYYYDRESSWFVGGTLGGFDAIAFVNSESIIMPITRWQEKCNYPFVCTFSCPWTNNADWSIIGSGFCQICPLNSNSVVGSSSIKQCLCNPGSFGVNGQSCQVCLEGTYKLRSQPSSALCTKCPPNSMSPEGSTLFCMCNGGWVAEVPGQECKQCPLGTYSRDNMGSFCEKCVPGKYSTALGSSSSTTCSSCSMGTYSKTSGAGACVGCSAGTYAEITGSSTCVNCMSHTYSSVVASSSRHYCLSCPVGTFSTPGSTSIVDCKTSINQLATPTLFTTTKATIQQTTPSPVESVMKSTPMPVPFYNDEFDTKKHHPSQKMYEILFYFDMSENVDIAMKHNIRNNISHVLTIDASTIGLMQTDIVVQFASTSAFFTITSVSQDASKKIERGFTLEKLDTVLQRASGKKIYAQHLVYYINYVSDKDHTNDNLKWYLLGIAIFFAVIFSLYFIFQTFNNKKFDLNSNKSIIPKL